MSWSYVLPRGPAVLYGWFGVPDLIATTRRAAETPTTTPLFTYADLYSYLESVVAVYVLGRCLGRVLAKHGMLHQSSSKAMYATHVTRVVTATLFVHVFAAGLVPTAWTIVLRFVTAVLAGMLCGMTSIPSLGQVIVEAVLSVSTSTKTYWIGFLTCVLITSFIRAHQAVVWMPLAVVGGALAAKLLLSPVVLTTVAVGAEIILRFLLAFTPNQPPVPRQIRTRSQEVATPKTGQRLWQNMSRVGTRASADRSSPRRSPAHDASASSSFSSLGSAEPTGSHETEICRYKDGCCVYADGSPAYVPAGDCSGTVPTNFTVFYQYDANRARRAWEATQAWRRSQHVWKIHTLPNRWFPRIKEAYPHFIHGHSRTGCPIIYEQPGRMRLKELFRSDCQLADMIFHYQFLMEFLSNIICAREEVRSISASSSENDMSPWGLMVVMDVKGFGLSSLSTDVLSYLQQAGQVNKAHYPLCTKQAVLVNASYWLAGAFSTVKGLVPDSVQVDVASSRQCAKVLTKYIDPEQIPSEYGGTSPYRLGEHPYELSLRQLVEERINS